MRKLTYPELTEISGGNDLMVPVIGTCAIIGAIVGAGYGYRAAEEATKGSNGWVQYHAIDNGIAAGATLGAMGGAFIGALPFAGIGGGLTASAFTLLFVAHARYSPSRHY